MIERQIEIPTEAGRMNTFICHPERLGPRPVVVFLMDAPGIREELRDSIYGVALVTDKPDSPHLAPQYTGARLYFGCAETDQHAPREMIDTLRAELASKRANAEVEIYPGTQHGFAFPQRPVYNKPAAERHWERLFALFGGTLT